MAHYSQGRLRLESCLKSLVEFQASRYEYTSGKASLAEDAQSYSASDEPVTGRLTSCGGHSARQPFAVVPDGVAKGRVALISCSAAGKSAGPP
jgi:hypothetical protein